MEPKGVEQFNEWKIALVAAGGTTVLLLFVFCIWSSYYRRQLRQQMRRELLAELEWKDPQLLAMMESARAELRSNRNIENDWIVPYSDIVVNRELLLGEGSFGCVYQGTYSGCPCAMVSINKRRGFFYNYTFYKKVLINYAYFVYISITLFSLCFFFFSQLLFFC